jgi:hypothetical protein
MTYKIQINDKVRDATDEETAEINAQIAEAKAREKAETDKAKAKVAALAKLGLTADELTALLS